MFIHPYHQKLMTRYLLQISPQHYFHSWKAMITSLFNLILHIYLMKNLLILFAALVLTIAVKPAFSQQSPTTFTGAEAKRKSYKALYVLNNGDDKKINATLKNIKNALADPRLEGKLNIELVVFGDGVKVFEKTGPFEKTLLELQSKGVILAQCENTLRERKIDKSSLFPFISFVPSGNGEIIIRHYQGWAIVHP